MQLAKMRRGIEVLPTCYHRTQAEQDILFEDGKSLVHYSKHQDWLAIDIVIVRDGELIWRKDDDYEWLGSVWEGMGHIWGGRWTSLKDVYHFQIGKEVST